MAADDADVDLAEGLRQAFVQLTHAPLTDSAKASWHRRLIAITNSAKRDETRARASLRRFLDDWNREFPS